MPGGGRPPCLEIQRAADDAYDRSSSCEFTTFLGCEWTGAGNDFHHTVIFRNANVPELHISLIDTPKLSDFRARLSEECRQGAELEAESCDAACTRVIENPVYRWSQLMCVAAGVCCDQSDSIGESFEACRPKQHQPIVQERPWTSPIWYRHRLGSAHPGGRVLVAKSTRGYARP